MEDDRNARVPCGTTDWLGRRMYVFNAAILIISGAIQSRQTFFSKLLAAAGRGLTFKDVQALFVYAMMDSSRRECYYSRRRRLWQ
jgi:hypothetical protein